MTATLPEAVQQVFDRFITTEYTTIDRRGQPISWPVTPYYSPGDEWIDVTTGLARPKKAMDARANPKVALLFSDPRGSGAERAPQVLVQGTAAVDDRDLASNRERYVRDSMAKLPDPLWMPPPKPVRALFNWYFTRVYVHVRPERVYVWPGGDPTREPGLYDAHMEEVRSRHSEEPPAYHAPAEGGAAAWDERLDELGARYPTAALSLVAPDGFPFAVRIPISVDPGTRRVTLGADPVGAPLQPGLACLTAHALAGRRRAAGNAPGTRRPRGGGRSVGGRTAQGDRSDRTAFRVPPLPLRGRAPWRRRAPTGWPACESGAELAVCRY